MATVFLLFFVSDFFEHAILPNLHLGRISWFFTTIVATTVAFFASRIVLRNPEAVHKQLIEQNASLASQTSALAQQSGPLALAV